MFPSCCINAVAPTAIVILETAVAELFIILVPLKAFKVSTPVPAFLIRLLFYRLYSQVNIPQHMIRFF